MGSATTENIYNASIKLHEKYKGKISIESKVSVNNQQDLSLAYTPGVAEPCRAIHKDKEKAYLYTSKGNLVAVATDGSAVLGLGDIGPQASMPVMEGKSILFKEFAGIDAFPICLDTKDVDEFVNICAKLAPSFGGINLEDISAPRCFEIEEKLQNLVDIPVFHDDQHGTAIVVTAALVSSLSLVNKQMEDLKIVINGAGAAGFATAKLLANYHVGEIILCDTKGSLYEGRQENMNPHKEKISLNTNPKKLKGDLLQVIEGADVVIGLSTPGSITEEMIQKMAKDPIVFALANPVPEIMPEQAKNAGAFIVCTGRSDFPNQVNNVLAFPGIFRGALDCRAPRITDEMKVAASNALASLIPESERSPTYIIPQSFDKRVVPAVASAVIKAAKG